MTCYECNYHNVVCGTYFCDSRNQKRKTVRIDKDDAERDIDCLLADRVEDKTEGGEQE